MERQDGATSELISAAIQMFLDRPVDGRSTMQVVAELNERLVSEVPELGADPAIRHDLEAATAALGTALAGTDVNDPFRDIAVPEPVLDLVRTMARRRLDVTVVLRGFQVGMRLAWTEVIRVLDKEIGDPELRYGLLTLGWDRIATAIEEVTEAAVAAYTAERDAWVSGARARRAEVIAALLAGDPIDVDAGTATLGYRLLRRHLACTFWLHDDSAERHPQQLLERAAAAVARTVRAGDVLTHPDGTRSLSAWFTVHAESASSRLAGVQLPDDVQVAVGLIGSGVEGFARSHRQASAARAVALHSPARPGVLTFEEVELVSGYLDNPIAARELVARELGALAAPGDATARLRATALAYLRAGGNAREAAALLGTHKNTVLYRLRQIEEHLGRPVLERRLKLEVALTLEEHLGATVLPG